MRMSAKIFACIAIILFTFLSCSNDTEKVSASSSSSEINSVSSSSNIQLGSFCENYQNGEEGMPVMDCRVISYKRILNYMGTSRFITNKDTLKLLFPHIFNEEQRDDNCNYFTILLSSSPSLEYFILSQDMILYRVRPYNYAHDSYVGECTVITMPASDAMLICDDTAKQNLKDNINLDRTSMPIYFYPDWDCEEEDEYDRDVFFEF